MAILTHGSDLTLSPGLTAIVRSAGSAGTVRSAVERLRATGFGAVQLDATLPGLRPRDLSTRARRDLVAMLSRQGVRASGIDLFIPRKHYLEAEHVDRAMTATTAAIELAAALGRLPLSVALPVKTMTSDLRSALVEAADGHGVRLAVHAEDQLDALEQWLAEVDLPAVGAAIDPAALLARGHDPATVAHRLGRRLTVARLSDVERAADEGDDAGEAVRCPVGAGDLDLTSYRIAVDLATHRAGAVVLDLRGLLRPLDAAAHARREWDDAAFEG